ncbi:MAG: PH domain-containing protein, partial [Myxococcota bacterium]
MRGAFLFPRVVGVLVLAAVLSIGLVLVALINDEAAFYGALPVMWLLVLGPSLAGAWVAYRKEHYEIHGEHLLARRGGLLSDGVTELDIKNITHVKLRLPWLRHKFFKIGDVRVESAGSAASEITFQSVLEPEAIYQQLQSLMRDNGYALNRGQVLHQESPTFIGAITDVVQTAIGLLFTLLGIAVFAWAGAAEAVDGPAGALITGGGVVLTLGSALLGIGGLGARYLDLTRRTYTVYADTVEYTEGFLTRDNAFIPYENIADAATNRTFVDQILGLYDVSVSCQGSGSEIKFRRLSNGPALKGAISTLVANARTLEKPRDRKARPGEGGATAAGAAPVAGRRTAAKVAPADAWTAELQMDAGRALAPLVVTLPMLPIFLLASVGQAIVALRTRYSIGPDSMSREFSFIGSQSQSFAYDKVTGVQVNRSFIDGFFKTMTVQIWSIGAPQPLTLLHVKEKDVDLVRLLRQCGIDSAEPVEGELQQSCGFKGWGIKKRGCLVLFAVGGLGLVPAAGVVCPGVVR